MALCNNRAFLSKLLKFTVGTDCEEVVIHSDILKLHSTPWFDSNSASFTGDESIIIEDPDAYIFSLVCQYLYTGDYSITLPSDTPPPYLTSDGQGKSEQSHIIILEGNLFRDTETMEKFADYLVRRYNPNADYTEILLTYARLHIFAVKYELQELRDICLFRLLHLLHVFPICQDRVGDIVRLFDFAFDMDIERYRNLTTILRYYTARHIGLFLANRKFQILLEEQPTLANILLNTLGEGL
ncbi:hypothetical protein BJX63DRAFT_425569 [Aspergillus granulosus]|uniref:BTB domain-containing protein n=1 Tax=Aspergillus granulosus TaxID=176169 RepID=A0ABR4GX60_9EURO